MKNTTNITLLTAYVTEEYELFQQRFNSEDFTMTPDPDYVEDCMNDLISRDITTIDGYKLDEARNTLYDSYKDVHGISPTSMDIWNMTIDEVNKELESLKLYK